MVKAIFFDSGSVLVTEGYNPGIRQYEESHGLNAGELYASAHDRPYWKEFTLGNISEKKYYEELKKDFKGELNIVELNKNIYGHFAPNTELYEFIKTLKGKFILGVISNNPKEWFEYLNSSYGWDNLFTVKTVSGFDHIRKPDKRIFDLALARAGVKGEEAVYIDDRPERVQGANDAGMKVLLYTSVGQLKKDLFSIF
ncbi:MAG: HAD family phosphatase [Patescibacteria group bacterium]|jgi:HAD superfamily hydrolase (TIGR01509 family)